MYLKISPKPGISLVNTSFTASGVESLPVNPVPPVKITTSILLSIEQFFKFFLIKGLSSIIIFISTILWPDLVIFSFKTFPDLSDLY